MFNTSFLSGSGFHTRTAGQEFRAGYNFYGKLSGLRHRRARITHDAAREQPRCSCLIQPTNNVGRPARRSNANDRIVWRRCVGSYIPPCLLGIVFGIFDRFSE